MFYPETNSGPSARQAVWLPLRHGKNITKASTIFYEKAFP